MHKRICWKHQHKTEKEARRHMIRRMQKDGKKHGSKVQVYRCEVCGHWHFGHHRDNARRAG